MNLKFNIVKTVAAQQFVLAIKKPFFFRAEAAVTYSPKREDMPEGNQTIPKLTVFCHETQRKGTLLLTELMLGALREAYPNDEYVGKSFRLIKLPKQQGKKYNPVEFDEIEVTGEIDDE